MSYVSNENVWKRIRTGLFGLIFLDLRLCDTHPTRTLGGFPNVVSGYVEDLGEGWIGRVLDFFGLDWTRESIGIRVSGIQWIQWTQSTQVRVLTFGRLFYFLVPTNCLVPSGRKRMEAMVVNSLASCDTNFSKNNCTLRLCNQKSSTTFQPKAHHTVGPPLP